ncbi:hypothetical protein M422DRAFT_274576 [Sphaerobolus stellatus SS14]|uniref:Unplaced genomic scaffold SPHSTscaffold_398, whole genome shotgun sequence n=1 Tax=Sphaerobolus stellatus (strain SS14) TaxID=990650 RepID=A0A0C9TRT4_SPHS4|nr:hypothetical protein M422DRAFT_274576 [Sphaerobolus stellatus SS14]
MDVLSDLEFFRQDNANLLKEVQSLRSQAALLRERTQELERNLRERVDDKKPEKANVREFRFAA